MNKQEQAKFNALEKRVKELEIDKEYANRNSEIYSIAGTLECVEWWDSLDAEQLDRITTTLKRANKVWFDRVGIAVQFIEHKYER